MKRLRASRSLSGIFLEQAQIVRQLSDGIQQCVRPGRANPFGGRKRSQNTHHMHSRPPRHLDVFGRVAHINTIARLRAQPVQSQTEGRGVRFLSEGVFAVNANGEVVSEIEVADLLSYPRAASTRYDAKLVSRSQPA